MVSVFLSLLTVASVCWVTAVALHDLPLPVRRLGALTAAIALAVMIGQLTLSRTLFRANLELLVVALSSGFALHAVSAYRLRDALLAGLFCGLSLYTCTAAWVFPPTFTFLAASHVHLPRSA